MLRNIGGYTSQQLREELEGRGLPAVGNKTELYARLQNAVKEDPDGGSSGDTKAVESRPTSPAVQIVVSRPSSPVTPIKEKDGETAETKADPTTVAKEEQDNTVLTSTAKPEDPANTGAILNALLLQGQQQNAKLDQLSELTLQVQQQNANLNERFQQQDEKLVKLEAQQEKLEADVKGQMQQLEFWIKKIEARQEKGPTNNNNTSQPNSTSTSNEPHNGGHKGVLKPPLFDGETPIENFKLQFQAAVKHNGWGAEEQLNALILALRGKAADVLQTVPAAELNNERIFKELELRYGQSHVQELCKIQLHNRRQQRGERLQDMEREITKLARQAYCKVPSDVLNELTVDAFINAVRDDQLKLHLRTTSKGKGMNEVLGSALEYEAARASLTSDSVKLRKLDVEDIAQIEAMIDAKMRRPAQSFQNNRRRRSRSQSRCFRCQQPGHYIRDCKQPAAGTTRQLDSREKTQPFNWAKEHEDAFVQLKQKLCSSPILAYPRAGDLFILDTDASNTGIGAVLSQNQGGTERVLAYYSRALSKPEKNYCVTRRELLAVVDSVKHFHKYLYGQEFLLRTDHAALKWLMQFKEPEGQVARWIERLQTYTFKTEHRRGLLHNNADGMSRRPCSLQCTHCSRQEQRNPIAQVSRIRIDTEDRWTREQLAEDQRHDHSIAPIIKWIEEGTRPQWQEIATFSATVKSYWAQWKSLKIENGLLIRLWESIDGKDNKPQIVLPENRIGEVLQEIHNSRSGSHLGVNKTLDKIRLRFYWVNCRKDVEDWCRKCEVCAASKGPQTRTRGRMQQYNVGAPFERIAMDIAGPFPLTKDGNRYILVCIDYFSKWVEAYPIMNQEARTVADVFVNNWVCRFGVPLELHSDQGRNFESSVFQELCQILEIKKTRTTPLHPQSDGMVERFNRTLEEHLRKEVNVTQDNWDQCIPLFMMAYRSAIHDTTGYSPAMVVFGRELRLPCDVKFGSPETEPVTKQDYTTELRQRMINVHATVRDNIVKASNRMKTRYDRRSNSIGFKEGDLVWLYNPKRRKGKSPKLQQSWERPYKVIKQINDVVYRIQRSPRTKMKVVHIDRLTRYNAGSIHESVRDEKN